MTEDDSLIFDNEKMTEKWPFQSLFGIKENYLISQNTVPSTLKEEISYSTDT